MDMEREATRSSSWSLNAPEIIRFAHHEVALSLFQLQSRTSDRVLLKRRRVGGLYQPPPMHDVQVREHDSVGYAAFTRVSLTVVIDFLVTVLTFYNTLQVGTFFSFVVKEGEKKRQESRKRRRERTKPDRTRQRRRGRRERVVRGGEEERNIRDVTSPIITVFLPSNPYILARF